MHMFNIETKLLHKLERLDADNQMDKVKYLNLIL